MVDVNTLHGQSRPIRHDEPGSSAPAQKYSSLWWCAVSSGWRFTPVVPPVVTDDESRLFTEHWDFRRISSARICYDEVALSNINLTTEWRQSDEKFIEILNQVREGSVSGAALDRLNEQVDEDFQAPDDWVTVSSRRKGVEQN